MTVFNGSPGSDIFTGGAANDTAFGNADDDALSGGGGNDVIAGGVGADALNGGDGDDTLYSGDQSPAFNFNYYYIPYIAPLLDTGTEVDTLNGGAGDDRLFAGYGDNVDGGANGYTGDYLYISFLGAQTGVTADFRQATQVIGGGVITGVENISWVQGSNFDDDINVGSYASNGYSEFTDVFGMSGNDHLVAGYYTGALFGGDGNDIVDGRNSQYLQLVDGGDGDDTLYTNSNTFAVADGGAGDDTIYSHGETHGGSGDDKIFLQWTYYSGPVYGDDGDDEIHAAASGNFIVGGAGADTLIGSDGADTLISGGYIVTTNSPLDDVGLEHDSLSGGAANDQLYAGYGDDVDGGAGVDTLNLSLGGRTSGVTLDTAGIASGQPFVFGGATIQNVEVLAYLRGSDFADTLDLATQAGLLTVDAGDGDDVVYSHNSSVSLNGGAGDDRFVSGAAGDIFSGGAGNDTIDYSNAAAGVSVDLATRSGAGGDQLSSVENAVGSAFDDTLAGDWNDNGLDGGAGTNTVSYATAFSGVRVSLALQGVAQNTVGAGVDTLSHFQNLVGSAFNDTLAGDGGNNRLDGGGGIDTVSYAAAAAGVAVSLALQETAQDTLGAGSDTLSHFSNLVGSAFDDALTGDYLANTLEGGGGDDRLDGGGGGDTVSYASAAAGVKVSLALQGSAQDTLGAGVDTLSHFQNVTGSALDDTIAGDGVNNVLDGGAGVDTVSYASAGAGVTVSLALQGAPQNTAGAGYDTLLNFENLTGSAFNDILSGDGGDNVLDGGGGQNTVSYAGASAGVTVSLGLLGFTQNTVGAGVDTLSNFQVLVGSAFNDVLTRGVTSTAILAGAGDDEIRVLDGITYGQQAITTALDGGAGTDTLHTFGWFDLTTATLSGIERLKLDIGIANGSNLTISAAQIGAGLSPALAVTGSASSDHILISGVAGATADLSGWSFSNWGADDVVNFAGSSGADVLRLNASNNSLVIANFSAGADTLALTATAGQPLATNQIYVADFQAGAGGDRLDLSGLLGALPFYSALTNPILSGYLRLRQDGADTLVQVDRDGHGDSFSTLATLKNTTASALVAENLGGISPTTTVTKQVGGGAGLDTSTYAGLSHEYGFTASGGTAYVSGGAIGTESLTGVERFKFVDGYFSTGTTDTAAKVYRIYEAALGRPSDPTGLANWVTALEKGTPLLTIGDGFLNSPEFIGRFGAGDNAAFVNLLYQNVLGRSADAEGLHSWTSYLAAGHSRSEVLTGFSESAEFIASTAPEVQHGLWVGDANAAKVARLYDTVFGRLPDASGETAWTGALQHGETLQTVAQGFVNSVEFQATYGALDNSHFVDLLYHNVLGRAADEAGLASWTNALATGHSRAEVVVGFSESSEHIANTAPHIDDGVWFG